MAADTLVSPQATATNSLVSSILLSSVWCFSLLLLSGNGLPADRQTHKHQHAPIPASRYTLNAEKLYRGTLYLNTHSHAQTVYILMYKDTHIASFGPPLKPHIHMLVALQITLPYVMLLKSMGATNEPMAFSFSLLSQIIHTFNYTIQFSKSPKS